jgi:hypothetical protein
MKTVLKEIFEYIELNDNSKEMYLVDWFEQNKNKLLEAEKKQIENSFNDGWKLFENKQKGNNYFGDIYFKEKYFNN